MRSRTLEGTFRQEGGSLKSLNASSACMHLHIGDGVMHFCLIGRMQGVPWAIWVCPLCQSGQLGDEQHLDFHCTAVQQVQDKHQHLFGDAITVISLCGKLTCVQWRNSSRNAWMWKAEAKQILGIRSALGGWK